MAMRSLTVELPQELVELLGSPEAAAAKARETLVIALLREGRLSHGQAAEVLGLSRWDLHDLTAAQGVPSGPKTAEEMRSEIEQARRLLARG